MLFQSTVPQLFTKMGFELYDTTNTLRKTEAAKRLNFFHDSQLTRLDEQLNELFADPSSMIKVALNITKKVINNLAQVYQQPPKRTIEGSEKDQELYTALLEGAALNTKMKQAQRYTKLLKTILLRPVWRNNSLQLDILTGNLLDVITGESPEILESVIVTDYGTTDKIEDIEYSLWTKETFQRLDYRGFTLNEQPNPYKVLPFIPVFDYPPISSSFWLEGLEDLISQQEALNIKLSDLMYLIQNQSYGVGFIKNDGSGGSLKVDPGSLVQLPLNKDAEIGFISQKAEITAVVEAIDKMTKWACVSNGLSAGSMSTEPVDQSGTSKAWDSKELQEARIDDIENFRTLEHKLFDLIKIVYNTHAPSKFSTGSKLLLDFFDPTQKTTSPLETSQADELKIGQGILSPVDVMLRDNPDIPDRETALAKLLVSV